MAEFMKTHADRSFGLFMHPWAAAARAGCLDLCVERLWPFTPAHLFDWIEGHWAHHEPVSETLKTWLDTGRVAWGSVDPTTGRGLRHIGVLLAFTELWSIGEIEQWGEALASAPDPVPVVDHRGETPGHAWARAWRQWGTCGATLNLLSMKVLWESSLEGGWDPLAPNAEGHTVLELLLQDWDTWLAGLEPHRKDHALQVRAWMEDEIQHRMTVQRRTAWLHQEARPAPSRPRFRG